MAKAAGNLYNPHSFLVSLSRATKHRQAPERYVQFQMPETRRLYMMINNPLSSLSFLILLNLAIGNYDFPSLLRKDRETLKTSHYIGQTDKLKLFNKFGSVDIKSFQHESSIQNDFHVDSWTSKKGTIRRIVRIATSVKLDTLVYASEFDSNAKGKKRIRANFVFTAYKFVLDTAPKVFIYKSNNQEGIIGCKIDGKSYPISYESIAWGYDAKYENQIRRLEALLDRQ